MGNLVGGHIQFQLVGETGPVVIGTYEALDVKPAPQVNERILSDGTPDSEFVTIGPWSISFKKPKSSLALERLFDLFVDPLRAPTLQGVYTLTDPNNGEVGQYLFTGVRPKDSGLGVASGVVNETIEFRADKRTKIA
jgi:hypothetical protein